MHTILQQIIATQRSLLKDLLKQPLAELVSPLAADIADSDRLEIHLKQAFCKFQYCKYLYVMDAQGVQLTPTISRTSSDTSSLARDRSQRPYMQGDFSQQDFILSEAYISKHNKRPSITAIHTIRDSQSQLIGYLGVDYDLRELPGTNQLYEENRQWQQIKGDPAIRSGLFAQQRMQSEMDNNIDNVFALMQELICKYGVFHGKFHFSSSRTTIWLLDDPYNYRLLSMNELNDPDICLAYPRHEYSQLATVSEADIPKIFDYFRRLRFADETLYLRAGSINVINGMVSLNFSCDGSHYLPYQEFLEKGMSFWFGTTEPNTDQLAHDELLETICSQGCDYVLALISQHRQGQSVEELKNYSSCEQTQLVQELESIMQVYQH